MFTMFDLFLAFILGLIVAYFVLRKDINKIEDLEDEKRELEIQKQILLDNYKELFYSGIFVGTRGN